MSRVLNLKNPLAPFRFTAIAFLLIASCIVGVRGQDIPPTTPNLELIPAGAYVIPMDTTHQAIGSAFNLRAYGLANILLQNNIPIKWAIKSGKAKDDTDFSAMASQIKPSAQASALRNFSGGPFIVHPGYEAVALPLINTYTAASGNTNVAVYQLTSDTLVDVRYTLTHKPRIGIGPNNFKIHQEAFAAGGFVQNVHFSQYVEADIQPTSCFTLITQPHTGDPIFANLLKAFVHAGGNFFAQCEATTTYETAIPHNYQTTSGYIQQNVNTTLTYPNGDMPMSQFTGALDPDPGGSVEDWALSPGSAFANNAYIIAQNSGAFTNRYAASVSKLFGGPGGMAFYLGGHDHKNNTLASINGRRMLLNAAFQPPTRPQGCGFNIPQVGGYKQVSLTNDVVPVGFLNPGDTVTWTVRYINPGDSPLTVTNFQIEDTLVPGLSFTAPLVVNVTGAGTAASPNGSFNGTTNKNLLASGATLGPGGMITVQIKTLVTAWGEHLNHPTAFGTGMPLAGTKTDTVDNTTPGTFGGYPIGCAGGCISQASYQTPGLDPTGIDLGVAPTSAPAVVTGRVTDTLGRGLSQVSVTILNPTNSFMWTATTNSFGYFRFDSIPTGESYVATVASKRYSFPVSSQAFTLNDDLTGLNFIGSSSEIGIPNRNAESKAPAQSLIINTRSSEKPKDERKR
jgi:fimbrial isopeptide formation D2 family protein